MDKIYNPNFFEKKIYNYWENNKYLKKRLIKNSKKYFSIMVPPPNITGYLHMGHALQCTIIDILIRYNRMLGKNILCQVGIDHAGIATQNLIEKKIFKETGKIKNDYSKNFFLENIWKWKKKYSNIIYNQMKRLGLSADWEKTRFTMDSKFIKSVRDIFILLYDDGLIYKKKKLIHWDFKLKTVISDLEVEHKKIKTNIWYIKYLLSNNIKTINNKNYLTVATTRPETLLADTAIAINPLDKRYNNLIGKFVIIPIIKRKIPIIADDYAKIEKGTGCVKISPAHDFNDYKIAIKHNLPLINIFDLNGNILNKYQIYNKQETNILFNENIPKKLQKINFMKARNIIIKKIKEKGLLDSYKKKFTLIPFNIRSNTIIIPMLTNQWYLNTKILSKNAINAVKKKQIKFFPKKYKNMFYSWMNNIQDWCISRQLWWGHQIPAWYDHNNNIYVGKNLKEIKKKYNLDKNISLVQDSDVLDTWFSSSLWTFITLNWPNNKTDFFLFHPTSVIVSGFDIIFFWISRMIMMTMYCVKNKNNIPQIPFKHILMTGLIRDNKGNKMSKSKGNIINPIDFIEGTLSKNILNNQNNKNIEKKISNKIYGADALRFTLASLSSTGRNICWDINRLEGYRNFCNKIWNAGIFILKNIKYEFIKNKENLSLVDKWIWSEYHLIIKSYTKSLNEYRFDHSTNIIYNFIWNKFCNWYLEYSKFIFQEKNQLKYSGTHYTLFNIFKSFLKLSHPIIPFITEIIWQKINKNNKTEYNNSIMIQTFPKFNQFKIDLKSIKIFNVFIKIITIIRESKIEMNIDNKKKINLYIKNINYKLDIFIKKNINILKKFVNIKKIFFLENNVNFPEKTLINKINKIEFAISLNIKIINKKFLLNKINIKLQNNQKMINILNKNIKNKNFLSKAPKKIIQKKLEKIKNYKILKKELLKKILLIKSL
ncbi:valine--tRNA ligase [Enterobacteriaceae endosymbiont of Donacia versicolorea]|uniref:valine--tRNA ligase n=1 Tax=Enterobacteriaceae endosymbiont of Donacia versicolorea TaxID=2675788 RepID=UPI0014490AED|nr:valine--tRNA ligase [Enterobacteriaceae endosymbiont of Donacia versicolorea]QJC32021.1 valine--tRNA ligase [Enterobacteriaceae endosymbiont of Donacia versicolorea]